MSDQSLTSPGARPSIPSLGRVEARKMLDTRSGLWLVALTALAAAAAVVAEVATGNGELEFTEFFSSSMQAASVLAPIVAILLVTSEWSQRTALNTFVLVPNRGRVMAGKLLAVFALLAAITLLCLLLAAIGTAIDAGSFAIELDALARIVLYVLLVLLFGFALAMVVMNSAAAIVLYFVAPVLVAAIGAFSESVNDLVAWIDTSVWTELTDPRTTEWGEIATTALFWIVIPMVLGLMRLRRRDVA